MFGDVCVILFYPTIGLDLNSNRFQTKSERLATVIID